jgi:molybdenum-dependent DNA-binding transcriptional regulator ModE
MARLTLRIDFDRQRAIGLGKIKLLQLIDAYGSIAAAAAHEHVLPARVAAGR